jgi:arylsulfatase A-like enzyme
MLRQSRFLTVLLLAGLGLSALAAKPNFVLIFCDDLGYGDLGIFGHPTLHTPNLDRMAMEGQKWTSFYVGASVCTPSRAALLTGRLPVRNGMMSARRRVLFPDSAGGLPQSEITIAELLKTAGYATGMIGKWHLGHLPQHLPVHHGFDSYWGIPYSNDMDGRQGFPDYKTMATENPDYRAPREQFNVPILENMTVVEQPADQSTLTARYNAKAVEYIRTNCSKPFFLYLAHNLPHIPLFAGKDHLGKSRRGLYGDAVEEIDAGVGQILATLKELDLDRKTLVVFTSDNGPWLPFETQGGSAGLLRGGKGTTFEGGMREPAIFWWPGTLPPGVQMELGATMDLLPTFCSFAGVNPPEDRPLDGFDLSQLLTGRASKGPRENIFYWREEQLYAIRVGSWKAHFITEGSYGIGPKKQVHETPELYDMDTDPAENYNVARFHPDVIKRLLKAAEDHSEGIVPVTNQLVERIRNH